MPSPYERLEIKTILTVEDIDLNLVLLLENLGAKQRHYLKRRDTGLDLADRTNPI